MEFGLLFRKTSTCYSNPDIEYLDETSDYKLRILAKQQGISLEELREKNQQINDSISYLTKENHGRVYAGGFLRDALLSKRAEAPEKWDNEVRKKAITSAIFKNVREFGSYRKGIGHKLVFSLSEELEEKLNNSSLNVDEILAKEVKKVMYSFQKKFHKGEKIGFAWGIHHDTKHRHIHVYLCNRTEKGTHVAMSSPLKGRSRKYQQKDQMGYIKAQLQISQKRILSEIKKAENGYLSAQVKEMTLPKVPSTDQYKEDEEKLKNMRQDLSKKEQELVNQQDLIRRRYNDYFLQKAIIQSGYSKVKRMNKELEEKYLSLKKSKSVVSFKLLDQLGLLPKSGPTRDFFRCMEVLQASQDKARREAILQQINASKEERIRLQNQLKVQDWLQKAFHKDIEALKEQKAQIRKEYYKTRYQYERDLLKHNYKVFMGTVSDKELRNQYYETTKLLWVKRRNREDSSGELEKIRKLDLLVVKIKKSTKVLPEIKPEDQGRGIKF